MSDLKFASGSSSAHGSSPPLELDRTIVGHRTSCSRSHLVGTRDRARSGGGAPTIAGCRICATVSAPSTRRGTGPHEVAVGVDRPHLGARGEPVVGDELLGESGGMRRGGSRTGATSTTSAGAGADGVPRDPVRVAAGRPRAPRRHRRGDEVGHPVPGAERRVGPLEHEDRSSTGRARARVPSASRRARSASTSSTAASLASSDITDVEDRRRGRRRATADRGSPPERCSRGTRARRRPDPDRRRTPRRDPA